VRRALRRRGWRPDLLWTYWPHTASLVGRLGERAAVYHCIDDFVAIGYPLTPRWRLERLEAAQCRAVDLVLDRSEAVAARHRLINPATHLLPGGIDLELFDPERVAAPAADIAALPAPRVGLVGTLDDRLDCQLLADCARALPEVSFVLAGPVKRHRVDLRPLERRPNVHFRPSRPHSEVPAAIAALDVGLIPYRLDAATAALTPLKLYESLAMGKPVAATDLPYLRREPSGVRLARTSAELAAAVRAGLETPPSAQERAQWRAAAAAVSWDRQVDQVEDWLTAMVGEA
jgi:glycosyltransferase involved in cell wall biosynthesis